MAETFSFGEWIKQRCERLRLTQRELAGIVFCSAAMIKKIEADERRPSPELARHLATALKIPKQDQPVFVAVARREQPVDRLWHVSTDTAAPPIPVHEPAALPKPAWETGQKMSLSEAFSFLLA